MFWAVHVNSSAYYHEPVSGHERSRKMYAWVWSLPPAVSKFWQFQKCHLKARVHQERVGLQLYPSKLLRLSMLTDHPDSSVTKKKTVWKFVPESMLHPPNTHTQKCNPGAFLGETVWKLLDCVSPQVHFTHLLAPLRHEVLCLLVSPLCSTVCSCPSSSPGLEDGYGVALYLLCWHSGPSWTRPSASVSAGSMLMGTVGGVSSFILSTLLETEENINVQISFRSFLAFINK